MAGPCPTGKHLSGRGRTLSRAAFTLTPFIAKPTPFPLRRRHYAFADPHLHQPPVPRLLR